MKKIAIINQRYGLEVNGGSELYTRQIAEKLKDCFDVEILTTKALSYDKWENHYTEDEEEINGVRVRRFAVERRRNNLLQNLSAKLMMCGFPNSRIPGKLWIDSQGPYVPGLVKYIKEHKDSYDLFIFVTYLYYTTAMGIREVSEKSVLIPTAHDEYCVHFPCYQDVFLAPKGIIYLTDEEKAFVQKTFQNHNIPNIVAGVGVDVPEDVNADRFREKYGISGEYLIYTGRVDINKNCHDMFEIFRKLQAEPEYREHPFTLVIMGKKHMEIPDDKNIRYLGFVSEQDKYDGISGAEALWLPSQNESLSISVLEAMALGIPILVNGKSEVLKGHCEKSGGGYRYEEYQEAKQAVFELLADPDKKDSCGKNAKKYVERYFEWDAVVDSLTVFLDGMM